MRFRNWFVRFAPAALLMVVAVVGAGWKWEAIAF